MVHNRMGRYEDRTHVSPLSLANGGTLLPSRSARRSYPIMAHDPTWLVNHDIVHDPTTIRLILFGHFRRTLREHNAEPLGPVPSAPDLPRRVRSGDRLPTGRHGRPTAGQLALILRLRLE